MSLSSPVGGVGGTQRHPVESNEKTAGQTGLVQFDGQHPVQGLDGVGEKTTHILLSVPPSDQGDPVYNLMGEWISDLPNLQWIGYLSTTGVYGNLNGEIATEKTPCNPSGTRGERRMKAELGWLGLHNSKGLPIHIFRLPGIYGPGRGPFSKVKNGTARRIIKKNQVFSRIHVDDIAQVLHASINRPRSGAVYNVCDDYPAPPQDVIAHAAELLDMPLPPVVKFEEAEMTPMARSFYAESKKVKNDLIKTELGVSLRYRDYRQGLAALLKL